MSREITSVTIVAGRRTSARRSASKWVRIAGAIALVLSWIGVGLADEIVSPANINAATNPFVSFNQAGNGGDFLPYQWQVRGNDTDFSINDVTGTHIPVRIETGSPANSLYIKNNGRVGFRTFDPQRDLHVVNSNTPTLRLEQAAGAFPAQIWDVQTSSLGFDIVDVTNANKIPFAIRPGAPTNSLFVAATGHIGLGTATPDVNSRLDIRSSLINGVLMKRADANPHYLRIENSASVFRCGVQGNGDAQFGALTAGKGLALVAGGTGKLSINAAGQVSFGSTPPVITTHALVHTSGARLTAAGVWTDASSRTFKQDIEPITSAEARDTVRALQPVGYRYKNELDERYVGFIAEDVPELVATRDRKALAPMDITAVLTKVVQDQDQVLQVQSRKLADEQQRNDKLERMVESLMRRVTDLEQPRDGTSIPGK